MRINNKRMFPYPVLSKMYDDYNNCEFLLEVNAQKSKKKLLLDIVPNLKCKTLLKLFQNETAKVVLHLECGKTKFRQVKVLLLNQHNKIELFNGDLNEELQIICFVIASSNISDFEAIDNEFNKDYGNISFNIEKGSMLAISNQLDITLKKDIYDLSNVNSIISIISAQTETDNITIRLESKKIRVELPKETYIQYNAMGKTENVYTPILYSMFVIPALIYAFDYLNELDDWIEVENYSWFIVLKKKCEEKYNEFSKSLIEKYSSTVIAQELIDSPIPKATKTLLNLGGK